MSGFSVDNDILATAAKDFSTVGDHLLNDTGQIQDLQFHANHRGTSNGSADVFGFQSPDGITLGQKFDDLLGMAWTMAETMGKSLTQAADNLNTVNNNYLVTERTIAGE